MGKQTLIKHIQKLFTRCVNEERVFLVWKKKPRLFVPTRRKLEISEYFIEEEFKQQEVE